MNEKILISEKLFNEFVAYVANDKSWREPKKVFKSQKDFNSFPFKGKVHKLFRGTIEIKIDGVFRTFPAIKAIENFPGQRGRKETHITIIDDAWKIVKKVRNAATNKTELKLET